MLLTRHYDQRPFDENVCDALIANRDVKKPSKKMQNICDGRDIKQGLDFSYMCNAGHTVDPHELFAIIQNNRNGQPYTCVCDIRHTVHSDEPFAMSEVNTNDSA